MTFAPGQQVIWIQQHRGGYGYITSVKAEVVRVTKSRVVIKVWRISTGEAVEKTVKPGSLRIKQ